MQKCQVVVNLHGPCANEGHHGEGDGEDNPEQHVLVEKKNSRKSKTGSPW